MNEFERLRPKGGETPPIRALFAEDPDRASDFRIATCDMVLDYARTSITRAARDGLLALLAARGVLARRDAMFRGEKINETEGRAVLHTALRNSRDAELLVEGADVLAEVRATRAAMAAFAQDIRSGRLRGATGERFSDVINIGIGGSDLGPAMATAALAPFADGPRCHFLSNVDGAHATGILKDLNPARTLVVVASKTFTTIETLTNAHRVRNRMAARLGGDAGAHFAAVSSAVDKTSAFGIAPDRVFGFADWVGGRYSVWGPVGLALMLAIGPARFDEFLGGAEAMDIHFQTADPARNMPVMLALQGLWHNQVMGYATRAVLPYDQRLARLPAYLQQLEMESNGKGVGLDGAALDLPSGPVVWGEPGTNGQHAFMQLIHQGTRIVPVEFLVAARPHPADPDDAHDLLVANCLAQSAALLQGRQASGPLGGHRSFLGDRPSSTLLYPQLTPRILGQIIALYEHRVFVEGVMLGLNSFDQWGVELGKELAGSLLPVVTGKGTAEGLDPSTAALTATLAAMRKG